ncbi:poly(A)-binding protein 3 [Bonamia ostreae]|uniref:Poly(A)-binding protein 3 n=1 Tax=Bonamia ostreae TaxID=126728 RepID=A0ABV2AI48_9EUKA
MDNLIKKVLKLNNRYVNDICKKIRFCEDPTLLATDDFWQFLVDEDIPYLIPFLKEHSKNLFESMRKNLSVESGDSAYQDDYSFLLESILDGTDSASRVIKPLLSEAGTELSTELVNQDSDLNLFDNIDQIESQKQQEDFKTEEKTNQKNDEKAEEKSGEKVEEKSDEKIQEKSDEKETDLDKSEKIEENKIEISNNIDPISLENGKIIAELNSKLTPLNTAFVSKLEFSITNDELKENFKDCGQIISSRVIYDRNKKSKGFGFVNFQTREGLKKAISKEGTDIKGLNIRVSESEHAGTKVFLGNVETNAKYRDLLRFLLEKSSMLATLCIKSGYAFLVFENLSAANKAVATLNDSEFMERKLNAEISKKSHVTEEDRMVVKPSRTLYLRNIPEEIKLEDLKKIFEKYGKIRDSYLSYPKERQQRSYRTSFAFITFENLEEAINAHNCEMDRQIKKNTLRIEFSSDRTNRSLHLRNNYRNHSRNYRNRSLSRSRSPPRSSLRYHSSRHSDYHRNREDSPKRYRNRDDPYRNKDLPQRGHRNRDERYEDRSNFRDERDLYDDRYRRNTLQQRQQRSSDAIYRSGNNNQFYDSNNKIFGRPEFPPVDSNNSKAQISYFNNGGNRNFGGNDYAGNKGYNNMNAFGNKGYNNMNAFGHKEQDGHMRSYGNNNKNTFAPLNVPPNKQYNTENYGRPDWNKDADKFERRDSGDFGRNDYVPGQKRQWSDRNENEWNKMQKKEWRNEDFGNGEDKGEEEGMQYYVDMMGNGAV